MKKWDEERKLKNYADKINNAKPMVQHGLKKANQISMRQQQLEKISRETDFSSHASYRSEKSDFKDYPIFKQLAEYNLQQYTNKLVLRGYANGLQPLVSMTLEYQNSVFEDIKLLPGHRQKFIDLFKHLPEIVYDNKGLLTPDSQSVMKRFTSGLQSFGRLNNTRELTHDVLRPANRRQSQKHFSPYKEGLNKVKMLPKLPARNKSIAREAEKYSIDEYVHERMDTLKTNPESVNKSIARTSDGISKTQTKRRANQEQILISQHSSFQPKAKEVKSRTRNKLMTKLSQVQSTNDCVINIQLEQIRLMYQSFDNAKLASTLINIDIEEICNCLGATVMQQVRVVNLEQDQFSFDSYHEPEQDQDTSKGNYELPNMPPIEEQTFEMSIPELYGVKKYPSTYENTHQFDSQTNRVSEQMEESEEQEPQEQSKFLQTKSYFSIESQSQLMANDIEQFNSVFNDVKSYDTIPSAEVISNYCKNVMITTKMEREVAIICLIYIERLLSKEGLFITCYNWQNIIFTSLVIASKIWDDESFENNNFAKVMPQYTTVAINEMEKLFLKSIDYNLYIRQGDYAKQYFVLRTFADKGKRSFPLRQLDLQTIMHLQNKVEQRQPELLKKQQYLMPLNKSF